MRNCRKCGAVADVRIPGATYLCDNCSRTGVHTVTIPDDSTKLRAQLAEARDLLRLIAEAKQPQVVKMEPDGAELRVTLDVLGIGGLEILAVPLGTLERLAKAIGG